MLYSSITLRRISDVVNSTKCIYVCWWAEEEAYGMVNTTIPRCDGSVLGLVLVDGIARRGTGTASRVITVEEH